MVNEYKIKKWTEFVSEAYKKTKIGPKEGEQVPIHTVKEYFLTVLAIAGEVEETLLGTGSIIDDSLYLCRVVETIISEQTENEEVKEELLEFMKDIQDRLQMFETIFEIKRDFLRKLARENKKRTFINTMPDMPGRA